MKKNKPLNLDFQEIKDNADLITRAEFRSIHRGIGMVISFAQMQSSLFRVGQPYRAKESRIIRVTQGVGRISINLVEHDVKKQTIIVIPPNSLIEVIDISPDYDFQVIVPENDFLPAVQSNSITDLYGRQEIVLSLSAEEWEHTGEFFSLQHLVTAVLYDIRYMLDQKQTASRTHFSRQEETFNRFITLVNEHGKHERNISFYADKLCLTPHYLSTVIRETSGQTVMQWINQAVVLEAKVLLKHSDMLVFQISDELNFPNPSFFSKFFKRMTGMTPAEYQKNT